MTTLPPTLVRPRAHHFIGGEWRPPATGESIPVEDPYRQVIIGTGPAGDASDVEAAVEAATAALPAWSATSPDERAAVIDRLREGIEERLEDFAATWTAEVGIPITTSRAATAGLPVAGLRAVAELTRTMPWSSSIGNSRIIHGPVGVVGAITPWNYPLSQLVTKTAAAFAAGCAVVAKPSEIAPLCAFGFADIVAELGLPPGVFNLVGGDGPSVGAAIARHPGVHAVSFTGSTRTGAAIMAAGAPNITRVCLELGGKSAALVLDEEILERAVTASIASCLRNTGQTCTSLTRLVVPHHLADRATALAASLFEQHVLGDPFDEATTIGPLVSAAQQARVRDFIEQGIAAGARVVVGGAEPVDHPTGWFVQPTVFADVDPSSTIAQEEIFGPVLSIIAVDDIDHAVDVANGVAYGLAGAVWATDLDLAIQVVERIEAGSLTVNGGAFNAAAPYGGLKRSGIGYELGRAGIEEFLTTKVVHLP